MKHLAHKTGFIRTASGAMFAILLTAAPALAQDTAPKPLRMPTETIPAELFEQDAEDSTAPATLPRPEAGKATTAAEKPSKAAAYTAYQLGAYLTALREATRQVDEDKDPSAMALIGVIHLNGAGVPVDEKKAAEWFGFAVERNYAPAMVELGLLKLEGRGTAVNKQEAAALFEKAAEQNDPAAHYNMGLLFIEGQVRPQDFGKAANHFRQGAETGNADAQYAYALLVKEGRGTLPNTPLAAEWMGKAAVQGNTEAQLDYAIMLFNGNGVEANPREAATWLMRASESGNGAAQIRLARLYASGIGVDKDDVRAGAWYVSATEKGAKNEWMDTFWAKLSDEEKAAARNLSSSFKGEVTLRKSSAAE